MRNRVKNCLSWWRTSGLRLEGVKDIGAVGLGENGLLI